VLVIAQVSALGFLTATSGTDAVSVLHSRCGVLYPFFAAYLGWLGVIPDGSETRPNALLAACSASRRQLTEPILSWRKLDGRW